ncbi:sulfurtransferase [Shimazuella kribbensis]|uniref:sulfurtransferase n=1 Tax=Shimazuella kribbensis TaxID=139808 RepID=UPI00041F357A|nr:sulfurtransferase [Shimazuella kribbensis]
MINRIVGMDWVQKNLQNPDVVLADCRFTLEKSMKKPLLDEYLPHAVYFDLEKDLSSSVQKHGGRHPLPDLSTFVKTLEDAGIDENTHVIAYDDQDGAMSSRFWWLLTYIGHKKASIMDGNFRDWKKLGYPTSPSLVKRKHTNYVPHIQNQLLVSMDEVKQKLTDENTLIIDSREKERYIGKIEPIDAVAGHIPHAHHSFWKDTKNSDGRFLSNNELREHFGKLPDAEEIIVYCGSGVTATPNILALLEAGKSNVKLYAGSWSDWISYADNPIEKGERKIKE